jgi:transcriptional regulator with XRE-family HTH domain
MAEKIRNPLAQALGLVLKNTRDKMGGISSSEIAGRLGLAASHYRMIESGSAILQPSRAIKVIQTFETIEYVPLCQVLVAIQVLDSVKDSVDDMRTISAVLAEAVPAMEKILKGLNKLWNIIETKEPTEAARKLESEGISRELENFLTTEPVSFTADQLDNFMTPTYQYPISGQLYSKIGNILQGVAPFYLDTILELIENLKGITPRVTAEELARWESKHKSRITHIIGVIRNPEIIFDVESFDYGFLWDENFKKLLIIHRDQPNLKNISVRDKIAESLRKKFETERIKYDRELQSLEKTIHAKLDVQFAKQKRERIDKILTHKNTRMNNLWLYIMSNGYVVPFIDNASPEVSADSLYGSSLTYEETCEKLADIKELCADAGFNI